ncbi:MAG: peptide transporter substrate-binding protein [Pseudonocardia sp.]|nr:peptide transporter substrate-binding protein [Pseudonocardia sp.]
MRTPRFAACLAIPISVALLTSACGGSGGGPGSGGSGGRQTDATISVNSTEPENPLIPGNTNETGGGKVVDALFTGLVEYDPKTAEPRNAVAQSIETTDSKLYTIKLKPGWTFHDGTPVTAQNFVDAWNYTAYSPNGQQNASFFAQIAGFDQVNTQDPDGANGPLAAPQPAAQTMSGLRAVDDQTLEVTLAEPFSVFPTQLGYQAFMPLPRAFFTNQAAFEATPIGNGPFRFVSRQPGANIVLERYEQYGGERKPGVKGVEYRFYESAEAAYADVVSNNLDFIEIIPPSAIAGNLFETDLPNRSVSQTYLGLQRIGFPIYDARFQNPQLRQALSMAIDREAVNQQIFNGLKPPADGLVAPNVPGRAEGQCGELCTYQPAKAKQIFDATGFQGPIELTSNADAGNAEWMQATCVTITQALGRECNFVPVPTFGEFRTAINAREMSRIYRTGWVADYPSIENFLNPMYRTGGSTNDGEYSNPAVDALLARADAAPSTEEGNALYQEAERLIIQDMPAIPLYFQSVQAGWSARMSNVTVTQFRELDVFGVTVSS